jgi:acetate kinase
MLPLPASLRDQGMQRYGFHGLSYEFITQSLPSYNDGSLPQRLIVAHLGNGASLCAIRDGHSVATSMGFSTLDGLLMGTRCGSIDPGVLLHLMRERKMDEKALSQLLYNESGLLGVSGISADMQVLLNSDAPAATEAVALFCYTLVRAIGSMAAALQGVDGLVFTGGIGEHAGVVREQVCAQLGWLGVDFDAAANAAGVSRISSPDSDIKVWVIPTDEELVIAMHTTALVGQQPAPASDSG